MKQTATSKPNARRILRIETTTPTDIPEIYSLVENTFYNLPYDSIVALRTPEMTGNRAGNLMGSFMLPPCSLARFWVYGMDSSHDLEDYREFYIRPKDMNQATFIMFAIYNGAISSNRRDMILQMRCSQAVDVANTGYSHVFDQATVAADTEYTKSFSIDNFYYMDTTAEIRDYRRTFGLI